MAFCRLCFIDCSQQYENLLDVDGSHSTAFHTTSKYFPEILQSTSDPAMNNNTAEDRKKSHLICGVCWAQINSFHTFQQTILAVQEQYEKAHVSTDYDDQLLYSVSSFGVVKSEGAPEGDQEIQLLKIEEVNVDVDVPLIKGEKDDEIITTNNRPRRNDKQSRILNEVDSISSPKKTRGRSCRLNKNVAESTINCNPLKEKMHISLPSDILDVDKISAINLTEQSSDILLTKRPRGRPRKGSVLPTVCIQKLTSKKKGKLIVKEEKTRLTQLHKRKEKRSSIEINIIADTSPEIKQQNKDLSAEETIPLHPPSNDSQCIPNKEASADHLSEKQEIQLSSDEENSTNVQLKAVSIAEYDAFIALHYKQELPCTLCDFTGPKFSTLKAHYRQAHNENRGYLICCNLKYYRRSFLVHHLHYHLNPEYFKCKECGKCCSSSRSLDGHRRAYHSSIVLERTLECDVCHKRFAKKGVLVRHMLTHSTDQKDHVCNICQRGYVTESLLRAHIRTVHSKSDSRICELCGKSCSNKYALKYHLRDHDAKYQRQWPCDICGALLRNNSSLRRHKIIMHTDASIAYVCKECGKVTASENALRNHKRYVHVKERTHKCTICDKAFKVAKVLREHMTIHTGQHLYQCPYCPQTFRVSANMHHHRKRVHPKEWAADKKYKNLPTVDLKTVTSKVVL